MAPSDRSWPMIEPHLLSRRDYDSGLLREVERTGEAIYGASA